MSDAPTGCRVLAVLGLGEDRVLDAAVEAAERGRGRLIVASCPTVGFSPVMGSFYADCSAFAQAHLSRTQAFRKAIERIPGSIPVLAVCCEGQQFFNSLGRLVSSQFPDVGFVGHKRQAKRLRSLGVEEVVVVR